MRKVKSRFCKSLGDEHFSQSTYSLPFVCNCGEKEEGHQALGINSGWQLNITQRYLKPSSFAVNDRLSSQMSCPGVIRCGSSESMQVTCMFSQMARLPIQEVTLNSTYDSEHGREGYKPKCVVGQFLLYFILLLAICSVVIYGWCFYLHGNLRRLNIFLIAVLVFGLRMPLGTAIALDDAIILELIWSLVLRSSIEYADRRQRDEPE